MSHYETIEPPFSEVQEWIDGKVHGGLKAGGRGALAVLGSGFGKGLLITAALITATMVIGTFLGPGAAALGAGEAIGLGLTKAFALLTTGSLGTWLTLAAGGAIGSLVAAHSENSRIGKDAAEAQAALYAKAREQALNSPSQEQSPDIECPPGGHCAQLMQSQHHKQQGGRGR